MAGGENLFKTERQTRKSEEKTCGGPKQPGTYSICKKRHEKVFNWNMNGGLTEQAGPQVRQKLRKNSEHISWTATLDE